MATKTTLTVIVSLILIALIVLITNLGVSVFYPSPDYRDYCDITPKIDMPSDPTDYEQCNAEYETARLAYEQSIFYIFAGIGFVLLLLGLFIDFPAVQWTGLGGGGVLVAESIMRNFQNKVSVFIASVIIFGIFIGFAFKKLNK